MPQITAVPAITEAATESLTRRQLIAHGVGQLDLQQQQKTFSIHTSMMMMMSTSLHQKIMVASDDGMVK